MDPTIINAAITSCTLRKMAALKGLDNSLDVWHSACEEIYEQIRTLLPVGTTIPPKVTVSKVVMAADLHVRLTADLDANSRWTDLGAITLMRDDYSQHRWWRTPEKNSQPASPAEHNKERIATGQRERARKEVAVPPKGNKDDKGDADHTLSLPAHLPLQKRPTIRLPPFKPGKETSSSAASERESPCKMRCSLLEKVGTGEQGPVGLVSSGNAEVSSSSLQKWRHNTTAEDPDVRPNRLRVILGEPLEEDPNPPVKSQPRRKQAAKQKKKLEIVLPLSKNAFRRQSSLVPVLLPDTIPPPLHWYLRLMRMVKALWKDVVENEVLGLGCHLSMAQLASTSRDPSIPMSSAAEGGRTPSSRNSPLIPPWNVITEESLQLLEEMDISD
ncbi:hypothetical protein PAXRUDRAFT_19683 [Paxillus rubicundulus Ve08.2h10]|uniref:Uncharacterized protein n=1 Tax=Paxillus rubicundulus Ve08.2h10 TaxID=930991 RepID=A0A0D0CH99_9AGAM|nr:hypothetical protein PAXRUDRAFT_19683 [Paxillus rubicundulus Ve08.2h10]